MAGIRPKHEPWGAAVIAFALAAALAACDAPPAGRADYREAHPLRITSEIASHTLSFSKRNPGAVVGDEARFDAFVRDYLRRGRSPMHVVYRGGRDGRVVRARERLVTTLLRRAGVEPDRITLNAGNPEEVGADEFRLSYRRHALKAPDCGDWSGHTGYNPNNLPHTDFGCSYQRNIGLMLADPGDLVVPVDVGPRDARRSERVIEIYRRGEAAGSVKPRNEEGEISDVK